MHGIDLSDAHNQLLTLLSEAQVSRMLSLQNLACQIENTTNISLDDFVKQNRKDESQCLQHRGLDDDDAYVDEDGDGEGEGNGSISPQKNRSVSFEFFKPGTLDATEELNQVLRDRIVKLYDKLHHLIKRIKQREFLCRITIDYERIRRGWIQQIISLDTNVKSFTDVSDIVDLNVTKINKQNISDRTKSGEEIHKSSLINENELNNNDHYRLEQKIIKTESNLIEQNERDQGLVYEAENLLFTNEHKTPSGLKYQTDYDILKNEFQSLKTSIMNWKVDLDHQEGLTGLDDLLENLDQIHQAPKLIDMMAVSCGLMFVTSVDQNWSFGVKKSRKSITKSNLTNVGIQVEPFSFYVDIARLLSECDKIYGKLKANLMCVIGICENWQQLQTGRDGLIGYVEDLEVQIKNVCSSLINTIHPQLNIKFVGVHLNMLGNQLAQWQIELDEGLAKYTTDNYSNKSMIPLDKTQFDTNKLGEIVVILQRLNDFRRASDRLIKTAPSRLSAINNSFENVIQTIRFFGHKFGELGLCATSLAVNLKKREHCLTKLNNFIDELEVQSGLVPVSEYSTKFSSTIDGDKETDQLLTLLNLECKRLEPLFAEFQLNQFEKYDLALAIYVQSSVEADQRIYKFRRSLDSLLNDQDAKLNEMHQICMIALLSFNEFIQLNRKSFQTINEKNRKNEEPIVELVESNKSSDPFCDTLIRRWDQLKLRLELVLNKLEIERGALQFAEHGLDELNGWLNLTEVMVDTTHSELIRAATSLNLIQSFQPKCFHHLSKSDRINEIRDFKLYNPHIMLDKFHTDVIYYSNLIETLSKRIEIDLGQQTDISKLLDQTRWRFNKLNKSVDQIQTLLNVEYERCRQLKLDLNEFSNKLDKMSKDLDVCFDYHNHHLDEINTLISIENIKDFVKQMCQAQSIRYQFVYFEDMIQWLIDRAHLLALGPCRNYSHSRTDELPTAILLESEAIGINHRCIGLSAKSIKCVHLYRTKIEQLFLHQLHTFEHEIGNFQSQLYEFYQINNWKNIQARCDLIGTNKDGVKIKHLPTEFILNSLEKRTISIDVSVELKKFFLIMKSYINWV